MKYLFVVLAFMLISFNSNAQLVNHAIGKVLTCEPKTYNDIYLALDNKINTWSSSNYKAEYILSGLKGINIKYFVFLTGASPKSNSKIRVTFQSEKPITFPVDTILKQGLYHYIRFKADNIKCDTIKISLESDKSWTSINEIGVFEIDTIDYQITYNDTVYKPGEIIYKSKDEYVKLNIVGQYYNKFLWSNGGKGQQMFVKVPGDYFCHFFATAGSDSVRYFEITTPSIPIRDYPTDIVEEFNEENNPFNITPNPAKDYIDIKSAVKFEKIQIYNLLGIEVFKSDVAERISISQFPKGIYILKLTKGKKGYFERFIKE